jgi:hypothetical protein
MVSVFKNKCMVEDIVIFRKANKSFKLYVETFLGENLVLPEKFCRRRPRSA